MKDEKARCFVSSDLILLLKKNKCMCQKSETRFFSITCQEANAKFIGFFRSFLVGLELNLTPVPLRMYLLLDTLY